MGVEAKEMSLAASWMGFRSASAVADGRLERCSDIPAESVRGQRSAPTTAAHIPAPKPASIIRRLDEGTRKSLGVFMGRAGWMCEPFGGRAEPGSCPESVASERFFGAVRRAGKPGCHSVRKWGRKKSQLKLGERASALSSNKVNRSFSPWLNLSYPKSA